MAERHDMWLIFELWWLWAEIRYMDTGQAKNKNRVQDRTGKYMRIACELNASVNGNHGKYGHQCVVELCKSARGQEIKLLGCLGPL